MIGDKDDLVDKMSYIYEEESSSLGVMFKS